MPVGGPDPAQGPQPRTSLSPVTAPVNPRVCSCWRLPCGLPGLGPVSVETQTQPWWADPGHARQGPKQAVNPCPLAHGCSRATTW